jgi:hypothetical protein
MVLRKGIVVDEMQVVDVPVYRVTRWIWEDRRRRSRGTPSELAASCSLNDRAGKLKGHKDVN